MDKELILAVFGVIGVVVLGLVAVVISSAVLAGVLMIAWNYVIATMFSVVTITYLQAFVISVVITLLCGIVSKN